jgi:hypothetical protein
MLGYFSAVKKYMEILSEESSIRHRYPGQIVFVNYRRPVTYVEHCQTMIFETVGKGIKFVEVQFIKFNDVFNTTEDAIAKLDALGYRPAKAQELRMVTAISRGPTHIAALGSVNEANQVFCLAVLDRERVFHTEKSNHEWPAYTYFAAVLK